MQPVGLSKRQWTAYYSRLFGSHSYRINVHVMDVNQKVLSSVMFLDGQVNLQSDSEVRRTASITVSDPDGAVDFDSSSKWSSSTIWADRLIRIQHALEVPEINRTVTVTPFIGTPSSLSRSGAEVTVELQDKTALAYRGSKPLTVPKGMNAVSAIRKIMRDCTGERRFRLPALKNIRLSQPYSVGWDDEASPWAVATRIARRELDRQLIYSCDGYLLLRKKPTTSSLTVPYVTEVPEMEVDFTELNNRVRVLGKRTSKTKNGVTTTTQPEAIATIASGNQLSPGGLARNGVPRYWPLVISEDSITSVAKARQRAESELAKSDQLQDTPSYSTIPFFHGDADDLITLATPDGNVKARLGDCSIPLSTEGEMSIGSITRNVSGKPRHRISTSRNRTRKRVKRKKNKKKTTGTKNKAKGKK